RSDLACQFAGGTMVAPFGVNVVANFLMKPAPPPPPPPPADAFPLPPLCPVVGLLPAPPMLLVGVSDAADVPANVIAQQPGSLPGLPGTLTIRPPEPPPPPSAKIVVVDESEIVVASSPTSPPLPPPPPPTFTFAADAPAPDALIVPSTMIALRAIK